MRLAAIAVVSAGLCASAPVGADAPRDASWARPDLVAKVESGELREANVSWWGWAREDSTRFITAALASKAAKVTLDRQEGPWTTLPLAGRSNLELVIPEGVTLLAKRGAFHGKSDNLLRFMCATNVAINGGGTVRMWLEDYTNRNLYAWSEWRHAISLLGCSNVRIENLTVENSGGDGLYLGRRTPDSNVGVTVRDVRFIRNNRQGVSVITADGLLMERCTMADTCGTPPMAGIDFEPNGPADMLRGIVLRDCIVRGNRGAGFDFSIGNLRVSSPDISITLENCRSEGNVKPVHFHRCFDLLERYAGQIEMRGCTFNDIGDSRAALLGKCEEDTCGLTLTGCSAADPSQGGAILPLGEGFGWKRVMRPKWPDNSPIRPVPWRAEELERSQVFDSAPGRPVKLPKAYFRGDTDFLVYAADQGAVNLKARLAHVGSRKFASCQICVFAPDGSKMAEIPGPDAFGKVFPVSFQAAKRGFHRLSIKVGNDHVISFCETDAPIAAVPTPDERMPGLDRGPAEVYLRIPDNQWRFAVLATGGGPGELLRIRLTDPSGACVWDQDNVGPTRAWFSKRPPAAGVWRLESLAATKAGMDDYSFCVSDLPPFFFLSPEKTWTLGVATAVPPPRAKPLAADAAYKTPETSSLFVRHQDPKSGVVSYLLKPGLVAETQQGWYFTNRSMTDDGRFLLFWTARNEFTHPGQERNRGPNGANCGTGLVDFKTDTAIDLKLPRSCQYLDYKTGQMWYIRFGSPDDHETDAVVRRDLFVDPMKEIVECPIPRELVHGIKQFKCYSTHMTLTKNRRKAFVTCQLANRYEQGYINFDTGRWESWGVTPFYANHDQICPADDNLAMVAWEHCWYTPDALEYQRKNHWYPRMWLVRPDGWRELQPSRLGNGATHERWADDGSGFYWCICRERYGVAYQDLATGRQEIVCPQKASHASMSSDKRYVCYDYCFPVPGNKTGSGNAFMVGFWNRDTERFATIHSFMPLIGRPGVKSVLHPHCHPSFVCGDKYVLCTYSNDDGHMDLSLTPVAQLLEKTKKD